MNSCFYIERKEKWVKTMDKKSNQIITHEQAKEKEKMNSHRKHSI